ncbi:hypothetical protein CRENBAI_015092 [Crenichthys baileyi]|uniref:Uncharacterized protein n=1 Tax=Crenichthys baileyi TaxID=28760 RepID=A0AAV9SPX6_9TELE
MDTHSSICDPEVGEGILYRHGGTIQLNHVKEEEAAVPVWFPVRGTSQQEGFHFHQARWVTGTQVSTELFQAQGLRKVPPAGDEEPHFSELKIECEVFLDPLELFVQEYTAAVAAFSSQGVLQQSPTKVPVMSPLPSAVSPQVARTGPIKAGGLVFVLDHSWWTQPMRDAIDQPTLRTHHFSLESWRLQSSAQLKQGGQWRSVLLGVCAGSATGL